jgi:hypothetical protein
MTRTPLSTLLTFPFKDPDWFKKLVILALIIFLSSAIPILPLIFVAGYMARLTRQMVVEKREPAMPEWDDLGGLFREGWRPFAVILTYLLPIILIFFIVWLIMFVPMMTLPAFSEYGDQSMNPAEFAVFLLSNLVGVAGFAFAGLVSLLLTLILPAAAVHSVVKEKYSAAFHLKGWWPIFAANLGGFFLAFTLSIVLNLVFGLVSMILFFTICLCCLLPFLTYGFSGYFYVVYAALCADAYRVGEEKALASGKIHPQPPAPAPAGEVLEAEVPEMAVVEPPAPAGEVPDAEVPEMAVVEPPAPDPGSETLVQLPPEQPGEEHPSQGDELR